MNDRVPEPGRGRQPFISKSKYLWGMQCPKLLWHAYNAKHLIPEPDAAQQAIFDQGHEVGQLAKALFPDGVGIGGEVFDLEDTVGQTKEALRLRRPLFEAAFEASGGYARVDILKPAPGDSWDLIEVKSTTRVKDLHLLDLAFQAWVLVGAGVRVRKCILMHINPEFVRHGPIDPRQFFVQVNLTEHVADLAREVEDRLGDFSRLIQRVNHPEVQIGPHCDDPYTCPLHQVCWAFLPKQHVLTLYRGSRKRFELLGNGITGLKDIPDDVKLTDHQEIQRRVARTGIPHVDGPALAKFLRELKYPLSYLDFETLGTAIPLFDGVRPYQQVPFQFSLHVQESPGSELAHRGFLAEGTEDPRPEFIGQLRRLLGTEGSIVVYNAAFEAGVLDQLASQYPEHAAWIGSVKARMVDLLKPFKAFDYYHPSQEGSASIKAVLPALTGRGYDHLAIQEGDSASREFLRVTYGDVDEGERQEVRRQLEEYCGLDTEGMAQIVEALRRLAGQ